VRRGLGRAGQLQHRSRPPKPHPRPLGVRVYPADVDLERKSLVELPIHWNVVHEDTVVSHRIAVLCQQQRVDVELQPLSILHAVQRQAPRLVVERGEEALIHFQTLVQPVDQGQPRVRINTGADPNRHEAAPQVVEQQGRQDLLVTVWSAVVADDRVQPARERRPRPLRPSYAVEVQPETPLTLSQEVQGLLGHSHGPADGVHSDLLPVWSSSRRPRQLHWRRFPHGR